MIWAEFSRLFVGQWRDLTCQLTAFTLLACTLEVKLCGAGSKYLQKSQLIPSPPPTPPSNQPPRCSNLRTARLAAQSRLEQAWQVPRFHVSVTDEDGTLVDDFSMAGFVGTPGSRITYHLLPDAGSSDEKGGLVDVRDLEGDAGESLSGGGEGCTGAWSRREGAVADKKDRERWWHTERGRWRGFELA